MTTVFEGWEGQIPGDVPTSSAFSLGLADFGSEISGSVFRSGSRSVRCTPDSETNGYVFDASFVLLDEDITAVEWSVWLRMASGSTSGATTDSVIALSVLLGDGTIVAGVSAANSVNETTYGVAYSVITDTLGGKTFGDPLDPDAWYEFRITFGGGVLVGAIYDADGALVVERSEVDVGHATAFAATASMSGFTSGDPPPDQFLDDLSITYTIASFVPPEATVSYTRKYPRDDVLGSSPRRYPPTRAGRRLGGYR